MALPFSWSEFLSTPLKGFPPLPNVDMIKVVLQKNQRKNKDYPWQYSNYGFILLGHAIGVISGRGYWKTMDGFLSNELELQKTYLMIILFLKMIKYWEYLLFYSL